MYNTSVVDKSCLSKIQSSRIALGEIGQVLNHQCAITHKQKAWEICQRTCGGGLGACLRTRALAQQVNE
jgi:hypothetical protein